MSIDIQTLHDVLIALITAVGVAVTLSILMIAVGALTEHGKNRQRPTQPKPGPAEHVAPGDKPRQLISH